MKVKDRIWTATLSLTHSLTIGAPGRRGGSCTNAPRKEVKRTGGLHTPSAKCVHKQCVQCTKQHTKQAAEKYKLAEDNR